MKTKIYIMVIMLSIAWVNAQDFKLPPREAMDQILRENGHIVTGTPPDAFGYEDGDFDPPLPGQVLMAEWREVKYDRDRIAALLVAAPDDETGKQSPWYGQWQAWMPLIDQFLASKLPTDLLPTIPTMVNFRSERREELCQEFQEIVRITYELSVNVVRSMAKHIAESGGEVSAENLERFVLFFSFPHMGDPWPEWDDEWPEEYKWKPLDEAGILILDAESVVTRLKTMPWQRAEHFIGRVNREADNFFSFYTEDDEWGLPVLETKYRANKAAIDAKFEELKAWVAAQKAQAENLEEEE